MISMGFFIHWLRRRQLVKEAKEQMLQGFNADYIGDLFAASNGNVTQADRSCGLERQALQQIMRRYEIISESFRK